jgi:hypothetical protein
MHPCLFRLDLYEKSKKDAREAFVSLTLFLRADGGPKTRRS